MTRKTLSKALFAWTLLAGVIVCLLNATPSLFAQSTTSGDISGIVTDSTGAVIPHVSITLTSSSFGNKQTLTSNQFGQYRASLLKPGTYTAVASHEGFNTSTLKISVTPGQVSTVDIRLAVGYSSTTVEVTESTPLLNTESADLGTTFSQAQVQELPNPGNDLTYIAQTSPGVVMNTQGGYGNFSAFGLPATSNTFTVNGGSENDPFTGLAGAGASNLLLGNNDISEVTVTSNAYSAQFGGLGGSQVNEITRSGSGKFHGDATYLWNGSALNANDYFNNQSGQKRPRSNANQWSGSIGGPVVKDRTFFFFNTEGLRVIIPVRSTVYAPSQTFIASTLANVASQGTAAVAFYQGYFNEYTKSPSYASAVPIAGTKDVNASGQPNVVAYNAQSTNFAHEALYTGRVDQNIGAKDLLFAHFKVDQGVQPTFTSLLDPIFDANSPHPRYEGQLSETHNFSPNLINQFLFATSYQSTVYAKGSPAATAIAPFSIIFISGDMANNSFKTTPGGEDFLFPLGRNITGYQFIDDLSYVHTKHTIKAGFAFRRDDETSYSPQFYTTPFILTSEYSFNNGKADSYEQSFPVRSTQPLAAYTLGFYGQDEWKVTPSLTLIYGLRLEHNSNPTCGTSCFSLLSGNFNTVSNATSTPYSNLIASGQHAAFRQLQKVAYEPRLGFSWAPFGQGTHTQIRGGFGFFSDAFPLQVADNLFNNAPTNVYLTLGIFGGTPDYPLFAGAAGSFASQAAVSNAAFQAGFKSGQSKSSLSTIPGFSAPGFTNVTSKISYPTYEEYSLQIQQQLMPTTAINVAYNGNHGYHEPYLNNGLNAYNAGHVAGFPSLPASIPNTNFSAVTEIYSGASSNYNGLVVSLVNRSKMLTTQVNYSYSHALDEVSNGGLNSFASIYVSPNISTPLSQNYGNADYDTRHYFSGNYVFRLPYYGGPHLVTDGWQITGDAFHSTGLPFTFTDSITSASFANFGGSLFAKQTVPHLPNKCSGGNIQNVATGHGTPCAAAGDVTLATDFGQQHRNQVFGPSYTDTDISVSKGFSLSHRSASTEGVNIRIGLQAFNVLNHPNFAQPLHDSKNGALEGTVNSTVNTPTSILGSLLGGDASPRLVQLKAKLSF